MTWPAPIFYPTFRSNTVTVAFVPGTQTQLTVAWPAQANAVSYNVYGSASPYTRNKLNEVAVLTTPFLYTTPIVNRDVYWNIWVSWIDGLGVERFISDDPATVYAREYLFSDTTAGSTQTTQYGQQTVYEPAMSFYSEEIRRRHRVTLENDGEPFDLYLRRWEEQPCPQDDARISEDSDGHSLTKCTHCFGTGLLGGFYPKIRILARYGNIPTRKISFNREGMLLGHDFNSWTLWSPLLRSSDLMVRVSTNERFLVDDAANSSWRGKLLQQQMRLLSLQPGDIRYSVTDEAIANAFTTGDALPYQTPKIWG